MIISKDEAKYLLDTKCPMSKEQSRMCELLVNGYNTPQTIAKRLGTSESEVLDVLRSIDDEYGEIIAV